MTALDRTALTQGALTSLLFAVPCSIGSSIIASNDSHSPWVAVLWLGALAGFTLGAGIASWVQTRGLPLLHGMACASGTYLAAQGIASIIRIVRGKPVSWMSIIFMFSIVLLAGVVGGGLGSVLRKRGIVPGALQHAADEVARERDERGGAAR